MENIEEKPVLTINEPDGSVREVGINEIALSNHVTYQALVTLLIRKGIIDANELLDEVTRVHKERLGDK